MPLFTSSANFALEMRKANENGTKVLLSNGFFTMPEDMSEHFRYGIQAQMGFAQEFFNTKNVKFFYLLNSYKSVERNRQAAEAAGVNFPDQGLFAHRLSALEFCMTGIPACVTIFDEETPQPLIQKLISLGCRIDMLVKFGYKDGAISGADDVRSQKPAGEVFGLDFSFKPVAADYYQPGT